jgi:predicted metal-binding protein
VAEIPRQVSTFSEDQIEKDLRKYHRLALQLGASDARTVLTDSLVVQERARAKCSIPKCAEYGTNLHCPPHSPKAEEIREILSDFTYGLAIKLDINPEYAAGAEIQNCYLKRKLDEAGRYRSLGKEYKKMFFIVSEIESKAFYDGYYFAMGFAAGSCKNVFCFKLECQGLKSGESCRMALRARPSMEAVGFDVFGMANALGWVIYPIGGKSEPCDVPTASLVGLILIV